ncbi:MAG TPA: cupin domain-containing protein [Candidatus Wallbacteria bacterium]|nr:cupin domain-containing protein [Candidatus Wallbacteria bacterium]
MINISDKSNSEKYCWGDGCLGWKLLNREELCVIEEEVSAGKFERRHYHIEGRQFFYILSGKAVMEIEGIDYEIAAGQGITVEPGKKHQFKNIYDAQVKFLVITAPKKNGDRIDL